MLSSALGLEPNTPLGHAYLIPYGKSTKVGNNWVKSYECQFQIGYQGYVMLMYRSPIILSVNAEAIHEHDHFKHMQGSKDFLEFEKHLKDRGDLIGAFSHVKLQDGMESACVLPLDEIHKIRSKSETYKTLLGYWENEPNEQKKAQALAKLQDTPWMLWEDDMAAKSAIKKHRKKLPLGAGDALAAACEIDDQSETGKIDLSMMSDPDAVRATIETGHVYTLDNETGEVQQEPRHNFPAPEGAKYNQDDVRDAISRATTLADVIDAGAMINGVPKEHQDELDELYARKKEELIAKGAK